MAATWLDFILSRRYALTVTGDPIPVCPAAALNAAGGATAEASRATENEPAQNAPARNEPTQHDPAHAAKNGGADAEPVATAPDLLQYPQATHTQGAFSTEDDCTEQACAAHAAPQNAGPFLILPNNPSLIDPLLLYAHVRALKPLVVLRQEQSDALRLFTGAAEMVILPPAQDDTAHQEKNADAVVASDSADSTEQSPPPAADTAEPASADALGHSTNSGHSTGEAQITQEDHSPENPQSATEEQRLTHAALTRVADALAQGRSVILWPSPHAQHTGYECVPAHNPAFSLLHLLKTRGQALPELFLVRAEGLWGSRFSWYSGHAPSFGSTLVAQIPAIFLGPFLRRRPVRLVMRRHKLRAPLARHPFQAMLNAWFGAGHESALLVPHSPLSPIRSMPLEVLPQDQACAVVHAATQASTSATAPVPPHQPDPTQAAPTRTESPQQDPAQHAADPASSTHAPLSQPAPAEAHQVSDTPPADIPTETPQAHADQAPAVPNTPLADLSPAVPRTPPLLPVQHALTRQGSVTDASYGQHFSRRSLLGLAKAIGTLLGPVPAPRIGMSLPCGTGAMATYIAILDCTLEDDRIPVILDPNMSPEQLAQCAQETGITHVVTSRSFKGRGLPPNTLPVYLEDITPAQIMRGSALSFMGFAGTTEVDSLAAIICSPATALGTNVGTLQPPNETPPNDPHADVQPLFLQHQELMASLHTIIEQLSAPPLNVHSLSILGCLPPHNPLGLLVNVVLPLTCGVPIVTVNASHNAAVLARSAENYSVNFFTGSPASMASMLHEARSHLPFRYIMLSQDPCPPDLLTLIPKACPHATIFSADMHGNIVLL